MRGHHGRGRGQRVDQCRRRSHHPIDCGDFRSGERLVGQIAKRQAITNPQNTVFAVKRLIGRKFQHWKCNETSRFFPINWKKPGNGDVRISLGLNPAWWRFFFILANIKKTARDYLEETITDAVMTVRLIFNDSQRQATKDAGKIAVDVLRIHQRADRRHRWHMDGQRRKDCGFRPWRRYI